MRYLGGTLLLFALVLGAVFGVRQTSAQDGTPAADCAPLSEDEIIALADDYIAAVESGDVEQIDAILHDDVTHNFAGVAANVPGNDDEAAIYAQFGPVDFTIERTFVDEESQSAVILHSFSFLDGDVTGTAIAIVELECGQVKTIHQESTAIGAILGAAGIDPSATPEA